MYKSLHKAATEKGLSNPEVIARLGAAQTALETGFGKHMVGNNAFGIKGKGPAGTVNAATKEFMGGRMVGMNQGFRAYNSPEESASDFIDFLQKNKRYRDVLSASDINSAIAAQGRSGYATDPSYGSKLANIHSKYGNIGTITQVAQDVPKMPNVKSASEIPDDTPNKVAQVLTKQTQQQSIPKADYKEVSDIVNDTVKKQPETALTTASIPEPKNATTYDYGNGGKTTVTPSYKLYQSKDIKEQMSGFLAHVSRQYLDKFPGVKKHPEQAAQYYRERSRKAETARHYKSSKYITGKKEEKQKPKG